MGPRNQDYFSTSQSSAVSTTKLKLVIVGDGSVGKSSLVITYNTNSFPIAYVPTVFDYEWIEKTIHGAQYRMQLFDTAGQEDYDRLRPLAYPDTHVFLVCFDIHEKDSFSNVQEKWVPEIARYCPQTPRILVGCKADLRTDETAESCVTQEEGMRLAAELQCCKYMETSALRSDGLTEVFDVAFQAAICGSKQIYSGKKKSGFWHLKGGRRAAVQSPAVVVIPPVLPPAGAAPEIEIETCRMADDWLKLLDDGSCTDTVLVLSTGQETQCHKVILTAASHVFRKALLGIKDTKRRQAARSGKAILQVDNSQSLSHTYIYLSKHVSSQILGYGLEFFYSGLIRYEEKLSPELLAGLQEFSELFEVPYLKQICDNIDICDEELNPSISTYLCDEMGNNMKRYFLNNETHVKPGVQFMFHERTIHAHKCILVARNRTMAAMLNGYFAEGINEDTVKIDMRGDKEVEADTFRVMLEYLYTGHAPLNSVDVPSLLILADRYSVTRLTSLCELYLTQLVDRRCAKSIEHADIDVIGLLNLANIYNSSQLAKWCRHFISTNYIAMSPRKEWTQLLEDDLSYIERHRWPPVSYLSELEEYETLVEKQNHSRTAQKQKKNISCLVM